jgi:hypothetical protein
MPIVGAETVVDVKDVVALFVVVSIIVGRLAWLCENASGIEREFIAKVWVDEMVGSRQMGRQSLQGLNVWRKRSQHTRNIGFDGRVDTERKQSGLEKNSR